MRDILNSGVALAAPNEIIAKHPYSIIYNEKKDRWYTRFNVDGKIIQRNRKTREEIEHLILDYYMDNEIFNTNTTNKRSRKVSQEKIKQELDEYKKDFSHYKEINVFDIRKGSYLVSPKGSVYSIITHGWMEERIRDVKKNYKGIKYVFLAREGMKHASKLYSVARITCAMFNGLPPEDMEDPTVDHIDGDTFNNYYKNLRWVEREDNAALRHSRGIGETNGRAILTQDDVINICNALVKRQKTVGMLAEEYNVSPSTIQNIKYHKTWTYISNLFKFD